MNWANEVVARVAEALKVEYYKQVMPGSHTGSDEGAIVMDWVLMANIALAALTAAPTALFEQPEEPIKPDSGWAFPLNSKKAHYFHKTRSLCLRWAYFGDYTETQVTGATPGPDDCKTCHRRVLGRQASAKAAVPP